MKIKIPKQKRNGNCLCCRHELAIRMATQKFCPSCAVYTSRLRNDLHHTKRQLKTLRNDLFMLKRGIHRCE